MPAHGSLQASGLVKLHNPCPLADLTQQSKASSAPVKAIQHTQSKPASASHLDVRECVLGVEGVMRQVGLDLHIQVLALLHDGLDLVQEHGLELHHLTLLLVVQVDRFLQPS